MKKCGFLLLLLGFSACEQQQSVKKASQKPYTTATPELEAVDIYPRRFYREADSLVGQRILDQHHLSIYEMCATDSNSVISGDYDGDTMLDTALFIRLKNNKKAGVAIIFGDTRKEPAIFAAGKSFYDIDDLTGMGEFRTEKKGSEIWDISSIGELVPLEELPDSCRMTVEYDEVFSHYPESCGGGWIYWNGKEYKMAFPD